MQQHEYVVTPGSQRQGYSPSSVIVRRRDPWAPSRSNLDIYHGLETEDFLHASLDLETDAEPTTEYYGIDQRVQYLESTISVQQDLLQKCLSKLTALADMLEDSVDTHSTSITSITVDDVEVPLRIPILAIMQEDEDEVGARVPEFSASGFGNTEVEAIDELKSELGSLYSELLNTPDELLGVIPRKWRQGLSSIVIYDGK